MDFDKLISNKSRELGSEVKKTMTMRNFINKAGNGLPSTAMKMNEDVLLGNIFFTEEHREIAFNFHPSLISLEEHSHNFVEVVYIYKGSCLNHLNYMETLEITQDELLIIDIGTVHTIEVNSKDDIIVNCLIKKAYFEELMKKIPFLESAKDFKTQGYLHVPLTNNYIIRGFLERCLYEYFSDMANTDVTIKAYLDLIFVELNRVSYLPNTEEFPLEKEIVVYMWNNYQNLTLSKLANHFHLSTAYLSKFLKDKTGSSFLKILQNIRMEVAKGMILNTNDKIEVIAEKVGYQNSYYFTKLFKEKYSCLPSSLRK